MYFVFADSGDEGLSDRALEVELNDTAAGINEPVDALVSRTVVGP
jgi:hypothetical protein